MLKNQPSNPNERIVSIVLPRRISAVSLYPFTASVIEARIGAEARAIAGHDDVKVLFIDGVGGWNPATSGLIEVRLRAELPPGIDFYRIVGNNDMYAALQRAGRHHLRDGRAAVDDRGALRSERRSGGGRRLSVGGGDVLILKAFGEPGRLASSSARSSAPGYRRRQR